MTRRARLIPVLLFCWIAFNSNLIAGSGNNDSVSTERVIALSIGLPVVHGTSVILFNELWYKDQPREDFHFFNDGKEWNQVDKVGHFHSAFYLSAIGSQMFQWSGMDSWKSDMLGAGTSLIFMSTIELLDGFSSAYGASGWDMAANGFGILAYLTQKALWKEIRIHPKFSYYPTGFANIRPDVLGSNPLEEIFKDYNGQTYWLSFDLDKFLPGNKPGFIKWINVAAGYGASEMIYAQDSQNLAFGYESYRQYYIALDLDLSHIKTRSPFINSVIFLLNMVHLPAPGLEFNKKGVKVRYLAF